MTIEQRLGRLERQNRVMNGGLVLLLMAAVGGGVLGFAGQQKGAGVPDVIRAKMFLVVDDAGELAVALTGLEGGGHVRIYDDKGKTAVTLSGTEHGGIVRTQNGKGKRLVLLGWDDGGEGTVTTYNGKGKELVDITATTGGEGFIAVFDPTGRERRGVLTTRP